MDACFCQSSSVADTKAATFYSKFNLPLKKTGESFINPKG